MLLSTSCTCGWDFKQRSHIHVDESLSKCLAGCESSFMFYQLVWVQRVNGKLYEHRPYIHTLTHSLTLYTGYNNSITIPWVRIIHRNLNLTDSVILCWLDRPSQYVVQYCWHRIWRAKIGTNPVDTPVYGVHGVRLRGGSSGTMTDRG